MSTKTQKAPTAAKTAAKPKLDLRQLQAQQLSGEEIEKAKGNQDDSYSFPAHESDRLHLKLVKKENDPVKKEYVSKEKIVKLVPTQYQRMELNGSFAEYDEQTILHDPRPKAVASVATQPAEPGKPKEPAQPLSTIPTVQDAQMRYQQLYNEVAPAVGYDELIELIKAKNGLTEAEAEELAAE